MTKIRKTLLEGVVEIIPRRFGDDRGYFSETYNSKDLSGHGITFDFCQDNHSYSRDPFVLRGLHYQTKPFAQDKLVRVTRGSVFDVAVDIRIGSPTFGQWTGVKLTAEIGNQLLVPKGFAHGFLTLEPGTDFLYKVTNYYSADHDRSIRFDDPAIGIEWPGVVSSFTLSSKDQTAPYLRDADNNFTFRRV